MNTDTDIVFFSSDVQLDSHAKMRQELADF